MIKGKAMRTSISKPVVVCVIMLNSFSDAEVKPLLGFNSKGHQMNWLWSVALVWRSPNV